MKLTLLLILTVALIAGAGMALAQQTPATPPAQQPQMGPMMMCPCMTMMQKQMTPEQMKQMQGWGSRAPCGKG